MSVNRTVIMLCSYIQFHASKKLNVGVLVCNLAGKELSGK